MDDIFPMDLDLEPTMAEAEAPTTPRPHPPLAAPPKLRRKPKHRSRRNVKPVVWCWIEVDITDPIEWDQLTGPVL